MTNKNPYIPFPSKIKEVIKHTDKEYTFRMEFAGDVKPGQFFEVSIPKYGEAPISVSGIGEDFVDLTIRRVGRVTNEVFERYVSFSRKNGAPCLCLCADRTATDSTRHSTKRAKSLSWLVAPACLRSAASSTH